MSVHFILLLTIVFNIFYKLHIKIIKKKKFYTMYCDILNCFRQEEFGRGGEACRTYIYNARSLLIS